MDDGKRDGWEGQWMMESVMVGRESDMQECPPRGSPGMPTSSGMPCMASSSGMSSSRKSLRGTETKRRISVFRCF
jgi:hypothetical protein